MERHYGSIMRRLLTLIMAIFLAVTLLGCQGPSEVSIAARHRKLTKIVERQLRYGPTAFPLDSQREAFRPAP
jgi:hypothetical protein